MGNLTEEERNLYKHMFWQYGHPDPNDKDVTVMSFQDLVHMIRKLGYTAKMFSDQDLAKKFLEFDKDESKELTIDEFICIFEGRPRSEISEASVRKLFRDIDADKSGGINHAELKAAFAKQGQRNTDRDIDAMLSQCDPDGNGLIDEDEFMAIWNK